MKTIIILIVLLSSGIVFGGLNLPIEGAVRDGQIFDGTRWVDDTSEIYSDQTDIDDSDYSPNVVFSHESGEIFKISLPNEYPNIELTETNVFVEFPDMYGKYSIKDIKEALKKGR